MSKSENLLINEMSRQGFKIVYDKEHLTIEPSVLRLNCLKVKTVKRGMFKTDPALVPPELKEDNVFWIDEPVEITAITESGEEIPVYAQEGVTVNHEVIRPEE